MRLRRVPLLILAHGLPMCFAHVASTGVPFPLEDDAECGVSMLQTSRGKGPEAAALQSAPPSDLTFFVSSDPKELCGPAAGAMGKFDDKYWDFIAPWVEYFDFVRSAVEAAGKSLQAQDGTVLKRVSNKAEADILFCHPDAVMSQHGELVLHPDDEKSWDTLRGGPSRSGRRQALVFVEDGDSATVTTPPVWAKHPDVVRIVKPSMWRVEELRFACKDPLGLKPMERHMALLKILAQEPTEAPLTNETLLRIFKDSEAVECPEVPAEASRKVVLGMPLKGALQPSVWPEPPQWKPLEGRAYDVMFASGFELNPSATEFAQHRIKTFEMLKEMKKEHPEWNMALNEDTFWELSNNHSNFEEYKARLCDTRILVSNMAYGEWSSKDIEAALCGTVVVKTGAFLIDALPDIYEPNVTCLDVRPDLLDLSSVVQGALSPSSAPRLEAIRQNAYKAASPFVSDGGFVALPEVRGTYEALLREVASRPTQPATR